jgi:hypothetical protein
MSEDYKATELWEIIYYYNESGIYQNRYYLFT